MRRSVPRQARGRAREGSAARQGPAELRSFGRTRGRTAGAQPSAAWRRRADSRRRPRPALLGRGDGRSGLARHCGIRSMRWPAQHEQRADPDLEIAYEASGREAGVRSSCCMAFRTTQGRMTDRSTGSTPGLSDPCSWLRGYGPTRFLARATAVGAAGGSRHGPARYSWTPSTSTPPSWWVTTGADERRASSPRFGPSAVSASSRSVATTSRTSRWPTDRNPR